MLIETLESRTFLSATLAPAVIPAAQKANIQKLVADLKTIHSHSSVSNAQIAQLEADLKIAANGAHRPSKASVTQFAVDLAAAFADGKVTVREKGTLAADFDDILVSANVSPTAAAAVKSDIVAIVKASNLTKTDVSLIVADLAAIAAAFKN